MKLIIGLGNPGNQYKNNRHNVGSKFIEAIEYNFRGEKPAKNELFLKTDCFMNESGKFVAEKVHFYKLKPEDLFIVHDDLDLPLGQYKVQLGVGPKVHYGIQSVESELGTKDFWRVRIGVDKRDPDNRIPGEKYVLEDFAPEEKEILKGVFDEIYRQYFSQS